MIGTGIVLYAGADGCSAFAAGGRGTAGAESASCIRSGVAGWVFAAVYTAPAAAGAIVDPRLYAGGIAAYASAVMRLVLVVAEHLVCGQADGDADTGEVGANVGHGLGGTDFVADDG